MPWYHINQKDLTCLDQVLLMIAGIFLHFADHPEEEVKTSMLIRLEKRWKDCDQPVFLAALILNLFEKLSYFGLNTNLNHFKCLNMLIAAHAKHLYRRMKGHPSNEDTPEQKKTKETEVSKAFEQYLTGTGDFGDFDSAEWEATFVWEVFAGSSALAELADFAITILQIVANQAGCEHTFSRTKVEESDHRNQLSLEKIERQTKACAQIRSEHIKQGLYKPRKGRKNHKSTVSLLSVPCYHDLLKDQNDKDPSERGRALVSSAEGWRTQVAKWIGNAKAAERAEWESEDNNAIPNAIPSEEATPCVPNHIPVWKPITLQVLFSGGKKPRTCKPSPQVMEEEEMLMQQLAKDAEDEVSDDGAIEIDSNEEYQG
ncbi:hypothetical protein B0H10DRAFT_1944306 [Mycena sp. CBHHK59/15]|nr:hypothetical protein B0H10DRAFT_1944306 [Mycena sp. CBHHK59/15]